MPISEERCNSCHILNHGIHYPYWPDVNNLSEVVYGACIPQYWQRLTSSGFDNHPEAEWCTMPYPSFHPRGHIQGHVIGPLIKHTHHSSDNLITDQQLRGLSPNI